VFASLSYVLTILKFEEYIIYAFEMEGMVQNVFDKELLIFGLFVYFSMSGNCQANNAFEGISSL